MLESMIRLQTLADELTRKTSPVGSAVLGNGTVENRLLHEFYKLAKDAVAEIERLEGEVGQAWADGDLVAWREHAGRAMQSLVMMAGLRPDDSKTKVVPAVDGMDRETAITAISELAEQYGDALVKRDNKKRKEAGLT
jgi:hypothetical protein